jgi:hypothetical protein
MASSFGEYRIANSLLQGIYTAVKEVLREDIYALYDSKIFNQPDNGINIAGYLVL